MRRPLFTARFARFERLYQGEEMSEIVTLSEAVGFIPSKYAREILNISKPTLKKLIDAGIIKANKINQRVIYCDLASIKEYMSGQRA